MFDWDDLRFFAAFARERSVARAARTLAVDHATVARRIAQLEAALQLKLVDRRPRAYLLTAEGERIAALAGDMEERAFAVARTAQAQQPGLAGIVTVSAPPAVAAHLIAPRLGRLAHQHPGIRLRLIGEKRSASLARREADLAVRLSRPGEPRLVQRRLGTFALALYAARGYAEMSPRFIGYDEAAEELPQQQWLARLAGDQAFVLRSNDLEVQRAAARAGVGMALLPCFMGDGDPALVRIDPAALAGDLPMVAREVWLVVHTDLRRVPSVRAVMEFLSAMLDWQRGTGPPDALGVTG